MNASDIAAKEFPVARKGYDPEAVRTFLIDLSESTLVVATPDEITAEAHRVADQIVADAHRVADEIEAAARADAESMLSDAERHAAALSRQAEQYRAGQEALATRSIDEAAHRVTEADARGAQIIDDAERLARDRAKEILDTTRLRLRRLLDAEREVHVRLAAAFSSIDAPSDVPLDRDDEELLDLAFAEFFSSDIEHDESRAWILSDHTG